MAGRFERRTRIAAAADVVFDYVADLERHPEWATNPLELALLTERPVAAGTRFRSTGKLMGAHEDTGVVTVFERPHRLEYETSGFAGVVRNWFVVEAADDACVLTKGSEMLRVSWFSRLLTPLLHLMIPRMYERNLRAIKARVETSARLG